MTPQDRDARIKMLARRIITLLDKDCTEKDVEEALKSIEVKPSPINMKSGGEDFLKLKQLIERDKIGSL